MILKRIVASIAAIGLAGIVLGIIGVILFGPSILLGLSGIVFWLGLGAVVFHRAGHVNRFWPYGHLCIHFTR